MPKLSNMVLAAMLAAPFVIKYLRDYARHRHLLACVSQKAVLKTSTLNSDSECSSSSDEDDDVVVEHQKDHFIRIPAFAVAAVIGKRGVTLRRLMYDSQTECVIRSYTPEELDVTEHFTPDIDWSDKFPTDDWFATEDPEEHRKKITYLLVRTNDEQKLQMVRLRIAEIVEVVRKPWKNAEFHVDSHMVGYLVGRGGRNIKSLRDRFNVQIQISEPNPENPEKSTVHIRGRDVTAMKEVEIVMKETVMPRDYQTSCNGNGGGGGNRVPRYDDDTLVESGIYENVEKELEDLHKAGEVLAKGFN